MEGMGLPPELEEAGMEGVILAQDQIYQNFHKVLLEHGGITLDLGVQTKAVVQMLYQSEVMRQRIRHPHPSSDN